jgi:hypothetical protein
MPQAFRQKCPLAKTGVLAEFNREYKRQRTTATASGCGFMSFSVATARLRRALVPLLVGGNAPRRF